MMYDPLNMYGYAMAEQKRHFDEAAKTIIVPESMRDIH